MSAQENSGRNNSLNMHGRLQPTYFVRATERLRPAVPGIRGMRSAAPDLSHSTVRATARRRGLSTMLGAHADLHRQQRCSGEVSLVNLAASVQRPAPDRMARSCRAVCLQPGCTLQACLCAQIPCSSSASRIASTRSPSRTVPEADATVSCLSLWVQCQYSHASERSKHERGRTREVKPDP